MTITKYALLYTMEREIAIPELFDEKHKAQEAMHTQLLEAYGCTENEFADLLKEADGDIESGNDPNLYEGEEVAYCTKYGNNHDWRIFKLIIPVRM